MLGKLPDWLIRAICKLHPGRPKGVFFGSKASKILAQQEVVALLAQQEVVAREKEENVTKSMI